MRALAALCSVYCVVGVEQAQPLQTGLRLCDSDVEKWKGCNDFGRNYKSEWEMTSVWVQEAADGSVCKRSHHFTHGVQSHKP